MPEKDKSNVCQEEIFPKHFHSYKCRGSQYIAFVLKAFEREASHDIDFMIMCKNISLSDSYNTLAFIQSIYYFINPTNPTTLVGEFMQQKSHRVFTSLINTTRIVVATSVEGIS